MEKKKNFRKDTKKLEKKEECKKGKKSIKDIEVNINVNFTVLAVVLIAIFCIAITPVTFQNDTFYTIKIGELIKNSGIDMMDHFSWHENLSYTYPHWLYDFITYLVYSVMNFKGIYLLTCALSVILGVSLFLVNSKLIKKKSIVKQIIIIGKIGNQNNAISNLENASNQIEEIIPENRIVEVSPEELEKMKNEINAEGKSDIYYVEEEKGGRKILQIKSNVQYEVDLAGIIKNALPKENELTILLEKAPKYSGIWISTQSRESFSKLLKNNGITNFSIDNDGYLKIDNTENGLYSNELRNMQKSNKLYIINMTGIAYERDYISGEITEYPFEDMDPTQELESYKNDNAIILEVTSNKNKKLTNKEILKTIVQY